MWFLSGLSSCPSSQCKLSPKEDGKKKKNPHKKRSNDGWKAMSCSLECLFCKQTNGNKLCWTFNKMHIILGLYFCQEKKKVKGSRERKMPWSKDHKRGFLLWDTGAFPWPKPDRSKCQMKNHENYKQVTYLNLLPFLPRPQAAARGHPLLLWLAVTRGSTEGTWHACQCWGGGALGSLDLRLLASPFPWGLD